MVTSQAAGLERADAAPIFNRWLIPVAAVAIHICIGSVYAWSTFNRPIKAIFPHSPWWFSPPYTQFTSALVLLGLSAAFTALNALTMPAPQVVVVQAHSTLEETLEEQTGVPVGCGYGEALPSMRAIS